MLRNVYEKFIISKYKKLALEFGDALSYSFMGQIDKFGTLEKKFKKAQTKVISYGYVPYRAEVLVKCGGYGEPLPALMKGSIDEISPIVTSINHVIEDSKALQKSEDTVLARIYGTKTEGQEVSHV